LSVGVLFFGICIAGGLIGYHIAVLLALGDGVTSVIAAALGATVVLFAWRMAK
jgi:hypothetical protein